MSPLSEMSQREISIEIRAGNLASFPGSPLKGKEAGIDSHVISRRDDRVGVKPGLLTMDWTMD